MGEAAIADSETPAASPPVTSHAADLDSDLPHSASALGEVLPLDASSYYDADTMAGLNPFSLVRLLLPYACSVVAYMFRQAAINRLRSYRPPTFPLWDKLPVRKRAAVLILLYADRWGDLRVVITMRAASLRSFSGHAALPGGKADSTAETPCKLKHAALR